MTSETTQTTHTTDTPQAQEQPNPSQSPTNYSVQAQEDKGIKTWKRITGRKRSTAQIEDIKDKILAAHVLGGVSPLTVAKQLNVPKSTIYRYIEEMAEETRKERLKKTNSLVHNYFIREERIYSELMGKWNETKDPRALAEANRVLNDVFDRLQAAGYLPKVKESLNIIGTQNNLIQQKTDIRVLVEGLKERKKALEMEVQNGNQKE